MGVWDKTTPTDDTVDLVSSVDDRIRELKDAIEEALSHEGSTFPGATPGTTPIFIPGMERGTTLERPTGDSLVSGRFYANTTLEAIERYNGLTWDIVASNLPVGTKMAWYQATPPTGWTAVAVNDKFLRVVTAATTGGTTGGTVAASTSLAHTHTVDGHTHTISADGDHSHTINSTNVLIINTSSASLSNTTSVDGDHDHGAATGSDGPGTDSQISGAFAFADVVIATKD